MIRAVAASAHQNAVPYALAPCPALAPTRSPGSAISAVAPPHAAADGSSASRYDCLDRRPQGCASRPATHRDARIGGCSLRMRDQRRGDRTGVAITRDRGGGESVLRRASRGISCPQGRALQVHFTLSTDRTIEAEARRTRRSKSAVVEALAEEAARRYPGLGFRGDDARRRPWATGSGLDVWEIAQMLEELGSVERLVAETQLTERQVRLALAYRADYPEEIADAIAENRRTAGHDVLARRRPARRCAPAARAAAAEERVLITRNSRDFAPLARQWAEAQRSHAGLILIWTLEHTQFEQIVAGIERYPEPWPAPEQWRDLVVAV